MADRRFDRVAAVVVAAGGESGAISPDLFAAAPIRQGAARASFVMAHDQHVLDSADRVPSLEDGRPRDRPERGPVPREGGDR